MSEIKFPGSRPDGPDRGFRIGRFQWPSYPLRHPPLCLPKPSCPASDANSSKQAKGADISPSAHGWQGRIGHLAHAQSSRCSWLTTNGQRETEALSDPEVMDLNTPSVPKPRS